MNVEKQVGKPIESLEERVEYSNATQFRKLFLTVIDELQTKTYLRYVITKHGEPRAVVMSFAAYNMMNRALQQLTKLQSETPPAEAAQIALRELRAEQAESDAHSAEVRTSIEPAFLMKRLNAVVQEVNDLRQLVGSARARSSSYSAKSTRGKLVRSR